MRDGIINIYKEAGYTSMDVVAHLRGILRIRRAGHTGTLDPDATGVLPVCLGTATRIVEYLTDKSKTYEAVMRLGITTDTQDISGNILREAEINVSEDDIKQVALQFTGTIEQLPPMYSAVKINGKKLVDLARKGVEVEREKRKVDIISLDIISVELPLVKLKVKCSKGTYIRTLCNDIGEKLGCGACMENLVRTETGGFRIEDALTLKDVERLRDEGRLDEYIIPTEEMFDYEKACTSEENDKYLYNGNYLSKECFQNEPKDSKIRVYTSKMEFMAIYTFNSEKHVYVVQKMFV